MRFVIAGATGVVGKHLIPKLLEQKHKVVVLSRRANPSLPAGVESAVWRSDPNDSQAQTELQKHIEGTDVLVNLAGSSVAQGRLTPKVKASILNSRLNATRALTQALEQCLHPPKVWLQASAIGYYGDTGDADITEESPMATDWFLADVCKEWEAAAKAVENKTRLIIMRIGLVLAKDAPAWQKMILPVRMGAGGPLGSGRQYYAWIDADDLARAAIHLVNKPNAKGVYNFTAPEPVRQIELVKKAAKRLGRPAVLPAPSFALRMILGETADALLLASCKALPTRLLESGFQFKQPDIDSELKQLLS